MRAARKFFLKSYGCQMNKVDGELVASRLVQAGYVPAAEEDEADVLLFNTCAVREHAEDRVWGRLASLKARKRARPELVLGVLGCMAQEHAAALRARMPHVDLVVGTQEFGRIDELLARVFERREAVVATGAGDGGDRIRRAVELRPDRREAFVNVIRGCDMPCSYCIVPATRGPQVSRPVDEIVDEVARLCADGVTEVTLLGQTVNAYGLDLGRGIDLALLLREVHAVPGLRLLSFVTSHPSFLTRRLIEAIADLPKVARYLHVPAQSGSDRILAAMKRGYTAARYLERLRALRAAVPEMEFASDFIVGFPGEREEDHAATKRLMEEVRFAQSFVFKYSPRPGTASAEHMADDVPEERKLARLHELLALQEQHSLERNRALVGRRFEVLLLGPSRTRPDRWTGRSANHRLVHLPWSEPGAEGRYVEVEIQGATAYSLSGEVVAGRPVAEGCPGA